MLDFECHLLNLDRLGKRKNELHRCFDDREVHAPQLFGLDFLVDREVVAGHKLLAHDPQKQVQMSEGDQVLAELELPALAQKVLPEEIHDPVSSQAPHVVLGVDGQGIDIEVLDI